MTALRTLLPGYMLSGRGYASAGYVYEFYIREALYISISSRYQASDEGEVPTILQVLGCGMTLRAELSIYPDCWLVGIQSSIERGLMPNPCSIY